VGKISVAYGDVTQNLTRIRRACTGLQKEEGFDMTYPGCGRIGGEGKFGVLTEAVEY